MTGKRNLENRIESVEEATDTSGRGDTDDPLPWLVYDMDGEYLYSNGEPFPTDGDGDPIAPPHDPLVIMSGEYADGTTDDTPERVDP